MIGTDRMTPVNDDVAVHSESSCSSTLEGLDRMVRESSISPMPMDLSVVIGIEIQIEIVAVVVGVDVKGLVVWLEVYGVTARMALAVVVGLENGVQNGVQNAVQNRNDQIHQNTVKIEI